MKKTKIKQSYWKLKPAKLPIWKQSNDDGRIGSKVKEPKEPKITQKEAKQRMKEFAETFSRGFDKVEKRFHIKDEE